MIVQKKSERRGQENARRKTSGRRGGKETCGAIRTIITRSDTGGASIRRGTHGRLASVWGSAFSRGPTPLAIMSNCFPRQGIAASCACLVLVANLVRGEAFVSSTKLVFPRQQAHCTTTPAVCMSSSARKESDQDVPSAREEGKRRTPQDIAGVLLVCDMYLVVP